MGAGLGGAVMAYEMKDQMRPQDKLTVVTKDPIYHFVPSNPWVAVGWRSRQSVEVDLAPTLAKRGIAFKPVPVVKVFPNENRLELADGSAIRYDYLVIATGPELAFDEIEGLGPDANTSSICHIDHALKAGVSFEEFCKNPGPIVTGAVQGASCFGASDREYARQQGRERDARAILEAERQRRQQEYVRKAQQAKDDTERQRTALQDSIKRTAEERVKAAESGLKVEEKRPLRFRTEEAARFGEMERQLSDQMSEVANRNMFVTPEQYLRFLRRPNRDQPLTEDERDFLRMDEERKILQHYQDPANLAPVATGVGAAVPPTVKPNVPTMRDRLEGVGGFQNALP